jgi:DNA-binding NarL/FixJ family response regulator
MAGAKKIRLLLADSRPVARTGLRLLLEKETDIAIIGELNGADQIVKKASALKPQVVLVDSRCSQSNGRSVPA